MRKAIRGRWLALSAATCVCVTAAVGLLTDAAFAASPTVTSALPNPTENNLGAVDVLGSGFTPGGQVLVRLEESGNVLSTTETIATDSTLTCDRGGLKPVCHEFGGGDLDVVLSSAPFFCSEFPYLPPMEVNATDLSTGLMATGTVDWEQCYFLGYY
jgi:hypothetical protein